MLLTCLKRVSIAYVLHDAGETIEVADELGANLVASGHAVPTEPPVAAADEPVPENAALDVTPTKGKKRSRR